MFPSTSDILPAHSRTSFPRGAKKAAGGKEGAKKKGKTAKKKPATLAGGKGGGKKRAGGPRGKKGPPPGPPGGRPPEGSDDEHQRRLEECKEKVANALEQSGLPEETRRRYAESVNSILDAMTPEALRRHHANTTGWRFYANWDDLTAGFKAKYPQANVGQLKGAYDKDGELHLNGEGALFRPRQAPLTEFHAHEITHSIDGRKCDISSSAKWRKAWNAEKVFLNDNGQSKETEGLAEFGQMLLGGGVTRQQLRETMKKCLKVWEEFGL